MSKVIRNTVLIFMLGAGSIFAQSSEIGILKAKRDNMQNLVRAYQDTLADLDFIISELKAGNTKDYSDILVFKKPKTNIDNTVTKASSANNQDLGNQGAAVKSAQVIKHKYRPAQQSTPKPKEDIKSSLTRTYKPKVQPKRYKRRVGAICRDGTRSYATGRGACSHHGGVRQWLYD